MKVYVEIINPASNEVLWHYNMECNSIDVAKEFATNQFIKDHSNDILLDIGGLFIVTAEEER